MGIGDWLMAAGEAQLHYFRSGRRVQFRHPKGQVVYESVFIGNPAIVRPDEVFDPGCMDTMVQGGGIRPYIYEKRPDRWVWKPYHPKPATLYFSDHERSFGRQAMQGVDVLVEPSYKLIGHTNKVWPREYWQALVDRLRVEHKLTVAQFSHHASTGVQYVPLEGVWQVRCESFRHAAACLAALKEGGGCCVLHEGGLHHAAAAVALRGVVIFGGFINAMSTGYACHVNLDDESGGCGKRTNCSHCAEAMRKIVPEEVAGRLVKVALS